MATALCVGLALLGQVRPWTGVALVIALAMFLAWSYKQDKMVRSAATKLHEHKAADLSKSPENIGVNIVYVILGLIGLTGGASLLIDGATGIARDLGVPESIIGLTMIALGASLPELFATVIATIRRRGDVAVSMSSTAICSIFSARSAQYQQSNLWLSPKIFAQ